MNNFPFIDIFILAMIAIFIINRLKNSLGKKTGNESDIAQKFSQKPSKFTESNPDKEIEKGKSQIKESVNFSLHENSSINEKLSDKKGRVLPDLILLKDGSTVIDLAKEIHSDLIKGLLYAKDLRYNLRIPTSYQLRDRDVISLVSASKK